jgi:photosystem II stability/assembly factor-like uncharacterized protein
MNFFLLFLLAIARDSWWIVQETGRDTNLRGVSATSSDATGEKRNYVVWASGSNGVILRSPDSGKTWEQLSVRGGSDLDFRDIEAVDDHTAYVMSSGDGEKSRIYKTADAGKTWKLQYSDKRPGFFLDALSCDSRAHCVALSDPVEGKFLVLATDDGEHWNELPRDKMPSALTGEGAFAASGTALTLCGRDEVFFGTGGGSTARVFHSTDRGRSWTAAETPIAAGNASSGIFSVACAGSVVVAVGGDYKEPGRAHAIAAYSKDSGITWRLAERQPAGYRSAVGQSENGYLAVGPSGTDVMQDELPSNKGFSWTPADTFNLNAVYMRGSEGWAVGPKGTIARFRAHAAPRNVVH